MPCIKYDPNTWEEIKCSLIKYGYKVKIDCKNPEIIVINYGGTLGNVTDLAASDIIHYNRVLVSDMHEFLDKAKKLIGYEEKDEFTEADLEPGMLVDYGGKFYLVCNSRSGLCLIGGDLTVLLNEIPWDKVNRIWGFSIPIFSNSLSTSYRKLLYEKKVEKVLTMQEIADKFNIPVEQLKIKK